MTEPGLLGSAALLALAGAGHCLGMCAGISGAFTFALPPQRQTGAALWFWQLLFSLGRVLSYIVLGALAGAFGELLMARLPLPRGLPFLASGILMLLLALTLFGRGGLTWLERPGQLLWRRLQPHLRRLLPVDGAGKALLLGAAWGLLPCGLVYSALALAATAASPGSGALVMLLFGLVTLPTVIGAGVVTGRLGWLRRRGWRVTAALLALAMAGWFFWQGAGVQAHDSHSGGHEPAQQHHP